MDKYYPLIFILVQILMLQATAYCPPDRFQKIETSKTQCAFRIECIGSIRNLSLPFNCQGSTNYQVHVDLTLTDATERFDSYINDSKILRHVITFRVSTKWPRTDLSFLKYMPFLKNVYLVNSQIERIQGEPFFRLFHLENVDLSHNKLADIEDLFEFKNQPNMLRKLSLAHNAIREIPGDTFEQLSSLIELDLSYNEISDLREDPFINLTSLEILRLNNNKIQKLEGALNSLNVNLKHLYLRGNFINNIKQSDLKIINHLQTFDLSGNELDHVTPIIFSRHWGRGHFEGVCKIILSENHITSLPNGTSRDWVTRFSRDLQLNKTDVETKLDLSRNSISNIEHNAFQSLVHLTALDLSCNKLLDFIVNPNDLVYVKYLNLSTNFITKLYFETFSKMSNLQNLDLSGNQLDYIPDEAFTNIYRLKHVNMSLNEIGTVDSIHINMFHDKGGVLDLSSNSLTRLNIPIGEGLHLTILILRINNITDAAMVNLVHQSDLETLEMSYNYITYLDETSLRLPNDLHTLNLNYNEIEDIRPSTFHRVKHLNYLYLSHNQLKRIEYGVFQGLAELSSLDLSYNEIDYLNSKVMMDLKSLRVLSLRYNGLNVLDGNAWLGHRAYVMVYLEGNNFTCNWLSQVLSDYNNGYSKMRPTVHRVEIEDMRHSLEGIPCTQPDSGYLVEGAQSSKLIDERLLIINQKILEAVKEQTSFLNILMNKLNTNVTYSKLIK